LSVAVFTAAVRVSDSRPTRRPIVDRSARHGRPATVFREPQVQRRARDPEAPSSLCQVSIAGAHLGQNCLALSLTQISRDRRRLFIIGPIRAWRNRPNLVGQIVGLD
jgi:hypothetical protein